MNDNGKIYIVIIVIFKILIICVCFSGCDVNPFCENDSDEIENGALIGFMGAGLENFAQAKMLGVSTVFLKMHQKTAYLDSAIVEAEVLGLDVGARAKGRLHFQIGKKIDFIKLKQLIDEQFSDNNIAKNLFGYYLIDEPCHPDKWDISLQDFKHTYALIKEVDNNIIILYNFSDLGWLYDLIQENNTVNSIVDIACFTVTLKKVQDNPDYIKSMTKYVVTAKKEFPSIKIVPLVAIYSSNESGKIREMPTPDQILDMTEKILVEDDFDGIMFFPLGKSKYMDQSIEDVINDPLYVDAFKSAFESSKQKYDVKN